MLEFGELKNLDVRQLWQNEPRNFTPWLAENLERLGEVVGMDLELVKREADVGEFSLDLLVKDLGSNTTVVIENQLEQTNHDHLGKLITYAAGHDATCAIWIATEIRDEHRQALEFLNRRSGTSTAFFAIQLEVIQIDESKPVLIFKPIISPNDWQKREASSVRRISEKAEQYQLFYQNLIELLVADRFIDQPRTAPTLNWLSFPSGTTEFNYAVAFAAKGKVRVEIWIGASDQETNKELFDALFARRQQIEHELGSELVWERLDDGIGSRISIVTNGSIKEESSLEDTAKWMADWLKKFKMFFGEGFSTVIDRLQPDTLPVQDAAENEI